MTQILTACDSSDDVERFGSRCDFTGHRRVGGLVRDIFTTGKEPQHGPSLSSDMVANSSTQHRISSFQSIKNRMSCHLAVNFKCYITADARKSSQVCRQYN